MGNQYDISADALHSCLLIRNNPSAFTIPCTDKDVAFVVRSSAWGVAHMSAEAVSSVAPSWVKRTALQDSLCTLLEMHSSREALAAPCAALKACTRPLTRPTATSCSVGWKQQSYMQGIRALGSQVCPPGEALGVHGFVTK